MLSALRGKPKAVLCATASRLLSGAAAAEQRTLPAWLPKYPNQFRPTASPAEFSAKFAEIDAGARLRDETARIAGRIQHLRHASKKLVFFDLVQGGDRVQVLVSRFNFQGSQEAGTDAQDQFSELTAALRRGDIVGVHGFVGKSDKGELSLIATNIEVLSPCLENLPEPGQLLDEGVRAGRRHLDMVVNGERSAWPIKVRGTVLSTLREQFATNGFLEVETPVLQHQAGGALARPFETQANALGGKTLRLRISPELYLKELVVGGLDRVYELGRVFRNEGADLTHNPEFTSCEAYAAYWGLEDLQRFTEQIVGSVAERVNAMNGVEGRVLTLPRSIVNRFAGSTPTESDKPVSINFEGPYRELFIPDALKLAMGGDELPDLSVLHDATTPEAQRDAEERVERQLRELLLAHKVAVPQPSTIGRMLDKLIGEFLEPQCEQPTFITGHPVVMSPLARAMDDRPWLTERFELFVCNRELCNAYAELNDPSEQRRRFEAQVAERERRGDDEAHGMDEGFVKALEVGLPPTGGWGLGVDRLIMLLSARAHIRDVVAFPMTR
jgi:lysyl-tRNA synthetase, class II